ncbi:MAG: enoyl-CoA hydratase/isomerase family protein [Nevskiales bacterium]
MDNRTIKTQIHQGGVGLITLARPSKRNALSIQLLSELADQLQAWSDEATVKSVVVTGEGSAFCAGFDTSELTQPQLHREIARTSGRYHRNLWYFPKPVVAAINGPALGGGFDLSTLCDLRIASNTANFGHPEVKLGVPPLFTPLRWLIGDGLARDLCLTGRRIDAGEALRIGLVSRILEPAVLTNEALQLCRSITESPTSCLRTTKRYLTGNVGLGFEDSFRVEHDDVFAALISGQSASPGVPR